MLVYIDDTIIFLKTPEDHVKHLTTVLKLLNRSSVTLSLKKYYFAQPGLKALGYWVSRLRLITIEEKVEAIHNLAFPQTLTELEHSIGFFGYYRKFVTYYADIVRPL